MRVDWSQPHTAELGGKMNLFCTNCGLQRAVGQRFCGGCGAALEDAPAAPPSPAMPAGRASAIPPQPAAQASAAPTRAVAEPVDIERTLAKPWLASGEGKAVPLREAATGSYGVGAVGGTRGADQLGVLLRRPRVEVALILAGGVTLVAVLVGAFASELNLGLYGLAYALAFGALGAFMAASIPRLMPTSRISPAGMAGITAGLSIVTLVVNQVFPYWSGAFPLVVGITGALAGFLVGCPLLLSGRTSPLVIAATPVGMAAGLLGRVVAEGLDLWQFGVGPLRLSDVVQAAAVFAPPLVLGVLGWDQALADRSPSTAVPGAGPVGGGLTPSTAGPGEGTNGLAIGSLVCSLFCFSLPAVVMGHIALSQIKSTGGRQGGRSLAIAGLIIGYAAAAVTLVYFIAVVVFAVRLSALVQ